MVNGGITKDGMSKSKVDACGVCSLIVKRLTQLSVYSVVNRTTVDVVEDVKGMLERRWSRK